jgi:hypothetical protein
LKYAAILVLLLAGAALAQDPMRLPFNPWQSSRVGDWELLVVDAKFEGKNAAAAKKMFAKLDSVTYRVRRVDATEVSIAFETSPELPSGEDRIATIFSRTEAPAFDRLLSLTGELTDVKATDEKRTIAGREFACTKFAYTTLTSKGVKCENAVWFSKDVKTFGLVEIVSVVPIGEDTKCTLTYRLAGFGAKDSVEFGKKPDDLKK